MDRDTDKKQLQDELDQLRGYLEHPISVELLKDNKEQQEIVLKIITDRPIHDIEGVLALLEARGHLRGLRRAEAMLVGGLEEIETRIKEL